MKVIDRLFPKNVSCGVCGATFRWPDFLDEHIRTEHPLVWKSQSHDCRRHERLVETNGYYDILECKICGKRWENRV